MTAIPLEPEILIGGIAQVDLPEPPADHRWRVEWRVAGADAATDGPDAWHAAASGLYAGLHGVDDTRTPLPQHRIEWRAVATPRDVEPPAP
jgi:hypothetical protein